MPTVAVVGAEDEKEERRFVGRDARGVGRGRRRPFPSFYDGGTSWRLCLVLLL